MNKIFIMNTLFSKTQKIYLKRFWLSQFEIKIGSNLFVRKMQLNFTLDIYLYIKS